MLMYFSVLIMVTMVHHYLDLMEYPYNHSVIYHLCHFDWDLTRELIAISDPVH